MAVNTLRVAPGQTKPRELKIGLGTAEGVRAFTQALLARHPQVIVRKPAPTFTSVPQRAAAGGASGIGCRGRCWGTHKRRGQSRIHHRRPALAQPYRAPETELERAIATMWTELLRTEPIGLDDNFFELGGHSLLALQLLPRIRERYQITLEPREFLRQFDSS